MRYMIAAAGLALAAPAAAQMAPQTQTVVTPVAPPATMVTQVAPGTFVVTPVPGVTMATKVKVQNFSDYDLDRNGVYSPMEFAQAMYFLATSDPVAGNPKLPHWDRYTHRGAAAEMTPTHAVTLLNATADEFAAVDVDNDWRVSPTELAAVAMM
jgi:hypothetical protein